MRPFLPTTHSLCLLSVCIAKEMTQDRKVKYLSLLLFLRYQFAGQPCQRGGRGDHRQRRAHRTGKEDAENTLFDISERKILQQQVSAVLDRTDSQSTQTLRPLSASFSSTMPTSGIAGMAMSHHAAIFAHPFTVGLNIVLNFSIGW